MLDENLKTAIETITAAGAESRVAVAIRDIEQIIADHESTISHDVVVSIAIHAVAQAIDATEHRLRNFRTRVMTGR